jgi:hypothetical protein
LRNAKARSNDQKVVIYRIQIVSRIPNFPRKTADIWDHLKAIKVSMCAGSTWGRPAWAREMLNAAHLAVMLLA